MDQLAIEKGGRNNCYEECKQDHLSGICTTDCQTMVEGC